MNELKPCPFCGRKIEVEPEATRSMIWIKCRDSAERKQ